MIASQRHSNSRIFRIALLVLTTAVLFFSTGAAHAVAADSLTGVIDRLLAHENLRKASIAVEIRSLKTGAVVYSRDSHELLIVASNNKLVTTASALHHLGENHRFETVLFGEGRIAEGTLEGDLVVKGSGDPGLCERFHEQGALEPLRILADGARQAGIERVTGDLVLDDTVFDREYVAPGWPRDQLSYYYCAPVAGLSFLENVFHVTVRPGSSQGAPASVTLLPTRAPFRFNGVIRTAGANGRNAMHFFRPDERGLVAMRGEIPLGSATWNGRVAVSDPPLYFGGMLRETLRQSGVILEGRVVLASEPIACDGPGMRRLAATGTALKDIVVITNKESHNNFAEHLFKAAGWKVTGKGSFASGAEAVGALFEDLGVENPGTFTIVDGSGLSRGNRFSAHGIVSLLEGMYASPLRDTYIRSLPIAGVDGSLEKRLVEEPYRKKVRAKTGWIREVSAFSGYLQSGSKEVFAFSILFNGYAGMNAVMKKIQDDICRAVIDMR
jgi:D-alanyl-D-alanine carboxypeptidase/D-alanyl-D-alanine-endopeptidase (penicillin-binding protein 4)